MIAIILLCQTRAFPMHTLSKQKRMKKRRYFPNKEGSSNSRLKRNKQEWVRLPMEKMHTIMGFHRTTQPASCDFASFCCVSTFFIMIPFSIAMQLPIWRNMYQFQIFIIDLNYPPSQLLPRYSFVIMGLRFEMFGYKEFANHNTGWLAGCLPSAF